MWNHDMFTAPVGKTVQVTRQKRVETEQSVDTTFRTTYEYQRDDVILASKCGKVIKSYWLPDESRWAGFKAGELPVAWMAWPSHPGLASDEVAA